MKPAWKISPVATLALVAAFVGVSVSSGCANGQPESCNAVLPDRPTSVVWPAAPDQARVAYLGVLQDNSSCTLQKNQAPLSLSYPKSIAAGNGRVYVSDRVGVRSIDAQTGDIVPFANATGHEAQNARGLAVAADGRVFVADAGRKRVLVYSKDDAFLGEIGRDGDFERPQGIAIDASRRRIYVADSTRNAVLGFTFEGSPSVAIQSTPDQAIGIPSQVAVNSRGEVYVVHQSVPKILTFDPEGKFLRGFGDEGDYSGQFVRPKGIAIDSEDHVWVSDAAFDNVQIFDDRGQLLLFLGQGGSGKGEFNLPFMMATDGSDRVYVADYGNHRVQVFQYLGQKFGQ